VITLRPADLSNQDDRTFVRSTWSRAFKQSNDAGLIHTDDWALVMHRQFDRILDRPGARAIIACDRDDPTFLYGWIAGDTSGRDRVVFFTYVKEPYRRRGIGRALFLELGLDAHTPFTYVCRTPMTLDRHLHLRRRLPLARFNPHVVRYSKDQTP